MSEVEVPRPEEQFVYVYRDKSGSPLYVGRGRRTARSQSHTSEFAHNKDLTAALETLKIFSIEIAGPFGTADKAAAVEAAVISAFNATPSLARALKNKNDGLSSANFRPLGVPAEFADRAMLPPLCVASIREIAKGRPVLFVIVNDKKLSDGRPGIDLATPPSVADIQNRMVCWWQLKRYMEQWAADPTELPSMLVAVSGRLTHRIVVGSLAIDTDPAHLPWPSKKKGAAQCRVPIISDAKLDHGLIRGRLVDPALAKFGQGKHEHFRIVR